MPHPILLTGIAVLLAASVACSEQPPVKLTKTAHAAASVAPALATDAKIAASCRACHQGPLAFAGKDPAELAMKIQAVLDGKKPHPPVQIPDPSAQAVQALATALTGS